MTAERKGDVDSVTSVRSFGTAAPSGVAATDWRKGTTISVVDSCTKTETRVAPDEARSRPSIRSSAAVASHGEQRSGTCRGSPVTPCLSDPWSRSARVRVA
jgi:hypothetical protein